MAEKFTFGTLSTNSGWRLIGEAVHLSDGTMAMLVNDPSGGSDSYKIIHAGTTHSQYNVVATIPYPSIFTSTGYPKMFTLVRGYNDDLIVVGRGSASSVVAQVYTKTAGAYTWTAQPYVSAPINSGSTLAGFVASWCNNGGGTGGLGYLFIVSVDVSAHYARLVMDYGKLRTGDASAAFVAVQNTGEFGTANSFPGTNLDIASYGFGGSYGVGACANGPSQLCAWTWSVNTSGVSTVSLVTDGGAYKPAYFSTATKIRVVNTGLYYLIVAPATSQTGNLIAGFVSNGSPFWYGPTDWGTHNEGIMNPGHTMAWDVFADPAGGDYNTNGYIITKSSTTSNQMWIINVSKGSVLPTWQTTAQTSSSWAITPSTGPTANDYVRVVKQPVSYYVDWQVQPYVSPYTAYDSYSIYNVAPTASDQLSPANGTTIDLTITQRFSWRFNDANIGDSQSQYQVFWRAAGSSGSWSTSGAIPSTNRFRDMLPNAFTAGDYEWYVRVWDSLGTINSSDSALAYFTAASPPSAPTITDPVNGQTIGASSYLVSFSYPTLQSYQWRVVADDGAGNPNTSVILNAGATVNDSSSRLFNVTGLSNNTTAHIQLRVQNSNLWSVWSDVRVVVSFTPPSLPTFTVSPLLDSIGPIALRVATTIASVTNLMRAANDISFESGIGTWIGENCLPTSDTTWAADGTHSLKLTPNSANNDTSAQYQFNVDGTKIIAGHRYKVQATMHMEAAQTGTLNASARCLMVSAQYGGGSVLQNITDPPDNIPQTTRLTQTILLPSDATALIINMYNGASTGGGIVWWDNVVVSEYAPDITSVSVDREEWDEDEGDWGDTDNVAAGCPPSTPWDDYKIANNARYRYRVTAIGDNSTTITTDWSET